MGGHATPPPRAAAGPVGGGGRPGRRLRYQRVHRHRRLTPCPRHPAKSGELGGGRLNLARVSGRVTWAHKSCGSGVMKVKRLHRLLAEDRDGDRDPGTWRYPGGDELVVSSCPGRAHTPHATWSATRLSGSAPGALPSPRALEVQVPLPRRLSARRRCRGSVPSKGVLRDRPAKHLLVQHGPPRPAGCSFMRPG